MLVQTVPDTASLIIPGAPVITFTDYERAIAALPGLTYYIDPASPGADRKSGAVYIPRDGDPLAGTTVSANMNGQPAWDINDTLMQFRLPNYSAKNSFTWLFAVYPTVIGGLTTLEEGALNGFNKFWWHSATTMRFHTSNTSGVFAQAEPGTVLAVNTRGIVGVSFDYATRKSSILFTDLTWSPEYTHTGAFDVEADPDARLVVGFGGGTNAMQGLMGDALYFDRALHLAPNAAVFAAARDAMATKYAIA
jgi:hypothetical protein